MSFTSEVSMGRGGGGCRVVFEIWFRHSLRHAEADEETPGVCFAVFGLW